MALPQIQTQDTSYKPWGMAAGEIVGDEGVYKEAANNQALQDSILGNIVKQKDAMVAQGQMNNPNWLKEKLAGEMGQSQSLAAAGNVDTQLADSKIKAGIAKHVAETSKAKIDNELNQAQQTNMALDKLIAAGEATGYSGMQFEYGANTIAQQIGADPQLIQQFLKAPPEGRATMLKALKTSTEKTLTYTPEVLRKMAEQENNWQAHGEYVTGPQNESHEKVGAANNSTAIQVARINAEGRLAAANARNKAQDLLSQAQAGKLSYEKAATAFEIMASMSQDPEDISKYNKMAQAFSVADQKSKSAGRQVPVDLSAVGVQTQQITPTLGADQPTPVGQTKSGVKYKVLK